MQVFLLKIKATKYCILLYLENNEKSRKVFSVSFGCLLGLHFITVLACVSAISKPPFLLYHAWYNKIAI